MVIKFVLGAAAGAALLFAGAAGAQTAAPTNEATGLPYCSAKVKDRCVQKSDLKAQKAAAAAKAS
ncbi:MAG: hypothetical protein ACK5SX_11700 [Sandaracinobacter sp.]